MSSALKENPQQSLFHDEASLRNATEKVMSSLRAYASEWDSADTSHASSGLTLAGIKEHILRGADRFLSYVGRLHCLVSGESRNR